MGYRTQNYTLSEVLKELNKNLMVPVVIGKTRKDRAPDRRAVFYKLCDEFTNETLVSIGMFAGGFDHATVLHGKDKIFPSLERYNKSVYAAYLETRECLRMIKGDKSHDNLMYWRGQMLIAKKMIDLNMKRKIK